MSLRIHWWLVKIYWNKTPTKNSFTVTQTWKALQILITNTEFGLQRLSLQTLALNRLWTKKFRWFLWLVDSKWYIIIGYCIWKLLKQIYWNTWTWFCSLFSSYMINIASMFEKDWNRFEWLILISYKWKNCRKRNKRWNMSCNLSIYKGS